MSYWTSYAARLRASAPYRQLLEAEGPVEVVRLPVPAAAWISGLLAKDRGHRILVLAPHEGDALAWLEATRTFTPSLKSIFFPAPALTPYQETELSLKVRRGEVEALAALAARDLDVVVTTPRALFQPLPDIESFTARVRRFTPGMELDLEALLAFFEAEGYHRADLVSEVGEFALRGGVLDCHPPGEDRPVRFDLFGDEIESIRSFDPHSQRSEEEVEEVAFLPLSVFPLALQDRENLAHHLENCGSRFGLSEHSKINGLHQGLTWPGWEALLPSIHQPWTSLVDLMDDFEIITVDPSTLQTEVEAYQARLTADYEVRASRGDLALPTDVLQWPLATVKEQMSRANLRVGALLVEKTDHQLDFGGTLTDVLTDQLPRFPREVEEARLRHEKLVITGAEHHAERLGEWLRGLEVEPGSVDVVPGSLSRGFRLPAAGLTLFAESQLFAHRPVASRRRARAAYGPFVAGLRDLKVGDFVVHVDHGVGQFTGLRIVEPTVVEANLPRSLEGFVEKEALITEVMEITYADGRTLLMPLSRVDQIQKYSGVGEAAPRLDKLGGSSWSKAQARVRSGVKKLAFDLLKLYAQRELAKAPILEADSDWQRQFEGAFAFDETEDQLEAIAAIKEDLERGRPMDRLLAGDVGFGKTEVAMRAAFKVVDGGYQVAVLAPTTILADQHLDTFRERFAGFPINIDMISRFRTPQEIKEIKERAKKGEVDILIGTHRLLSKDIDLPRLGLLVVDEEQRFGVGQKERLKDLKKDLHVLAMSATPVPRTLQLSMAGVRDLSVIETPPRDRMAVETAIIAFTPELVREAIEFELERSGQIYYVYNRVDGIEQMAGWLRTLLPDLKIAIGHGQMDEKELSRRMHAFSAGEYDLLLATTIIENGIHIPRVNTMIVHHAERFGLAQLYQLRGRVGRSDQLAYCYLMVPPDRIVSEVARKRLAALRDFTELGAGFRIAGRDLEIRGAGDLLGAEQSGHIITVGIETYLKMLKEAIREARGDTVDEEVTTVVNLPIPASIPESYVQDPNLRMEIYRKIAALEESKEVIAEELRDRFGPLPDPLTALLELADIKHQAEALRVQSIGWQKGRLALRLRRDARVNLDRLVSLVTEWPGTSFSPSGILSVTVKGEGMLPSLQRLLQELKPESTLP